MTYQKVILTNQFIFIHRQQRVQEAFQEIVDEIKKELTRLDKEIDLKFVVHDTLCTEQKFLGREPQLKNFASENAVELCLLQWYKKFQWKMLFASCKEINILICLI